MEKSLKVSERAHMKPRYLTQYLNRCKNAKKNFYRIVACLRMCSSLVFQLSITVPSIGLES